MAINRSLADEAEKLAKKISKKRTGSTGMWEMFLGDAYEQIEHEITMTPTALKSHPTPAKEPK